ncbi:FAD-binding monooxygenase [Catellatospora sp. KI3]|uniref:FAD-dependent oxidoreductase n=1 Tax=Catellatospora sp. KI3 TaxID=3041620 RepID=UPI0024830D71|nr:FAD-binding monooxygenase [Catellatospora sp. KI3]MDI1461465.1 FAD-binding monooxygenase [Catellatospora sp. KI3]
MSWEVTAMDGTGATRGARAVVIGGSIAGTLAARVLSEFYGEVVVVDRDEIMGVAGPRRGAVHSVHAHGLHAAGYLILTELFPGLLEDTRQLAGLTIRDFGGMRWIFDGRPVKPAETGLLSVAGSRPVLENYLRNRVAALPQVRYEQNTDVLSLRTSADRDTVLGVRLRQGDREWDLDADLVVEASGRGSRLPAWLAELGYERPDEERIKIGLAYTTRSFRRRPGTFGPPQAINPVSSPAFPRGAFFGQAITGDCRVSLTGMQGDTPPGDTAQFLDFTKSLPAPDIHEAIVDADPIGEAATFTFPASVWRHYERLTRFPDRLAVLGDAVCSFNPVYGQGMTVIAMQVMKLREHLATHHAPDPVALNRALAETIEDPWLISTSGDLEFPGVATHRPLKTRILNAYLTRLRYAATKDPAATTALMRVNGLVDRPSALWRPGLVAKVLWLSRDLDTSRRETPVPVPA